MANLLGPPAAGPPSMVAFPAHADPDPAADAATEAPGPRARGCHGRGRGAAGAGVLARRPDAGLRGVAVDAALGTTRRQLQRSGAAPRRARGRAGRAPPER